jgi:PGF-CTERM protein
MRQSYLARYGSIVFAVLLVVAGVGVVGAAGGAVPADDASIATDTPTTTPTDTPDPRSVEFGQLGYDVDVGATVDVTVELTGTDTATLTVGSQSQAFLGNLTLTDADGDGDVVVSVDVGALGGGDAFAAGEGDELTVDDATSSDDPGVGETTLALSASVGDGADTAASNIIVREPIDRSATDTPEPTATPEEDTPSEDTPSATPTSSPGLGPLAAVAALAAVALLARRR